MLRGAVSDDAADSDDEGAVKNQWKLREGRKREGGKEKKGEGDNL